MVLKPLLHHFLEIRVHRHLSATRRQVLPPLSLPNYHQVVIELEVVPHGAAYLAAPGTRVGSKHKHRVDERVAGGFLHVFQQFRDQLFVKKEMLPEFRFLLRCQPTATNPASYFCPSHELLAFFGLRHLDGPFVWSVGVFYWAGAFDVASLPSPIPNLHERREFLLDCLA